MTDPDPDPQLGISMGSYDRNGYCQWFGYGRVNAEKAVKMAKSKQAIRQQVSRRVERSNVQALTIPDDDRQGASSRISISDTSPILDIQVSVEVEHEFLGDVEIHLVEPGGKTVLLQSRTLGRSTSLKTTYTLQTTPYLRELLNLSPQGTWRLTAIDRAPQHTGKLKGWKLDLGL